MADHLFRQISEGNFGNTEMDLHLHSQFSDGNGTPGEIVCQVYERGVKTAAITDHCDGLGNFLFSSGHNKTMMEYIRDLTNLQVEWKGKVKVLLGLEITRLPVVNWVEMHRRVKISNFDWIMVDSTYVEDPFQNILTLSQFLREEMMDAPPKLGLAHPEYETLVKSPFLENLVNNGIVLELNEEKICKRDFYAIEQLLQNYSRSEIHFSIGSDAHAFKHAGYCPISWAFAQLYKLRLVSF